MCGIAGFFSMGFNPLNQLWLKKAMLLMANRGPDDRGDCVLEQGSVGFCHTRLSVNDLSIAGNQPMSSASGRYTIVYNGEIYNHIRLRNRILKQNPEYIFRGHSDTETLLALIDIFGIEETLLVVNGMFAFALWDHLEKRLLLARDRFGEKPVFYGMVNKTFMFASELRTFSAHAAFKPLISRQALSSFCRYGYFPSNTTIFEGIYKLLPGHYVIMDGIKIQPELKTYWDIRSEIERAYKNQFKGSLSDGVDIISTLLNQSIDEKMVSDVPVGAFLSGGTDSTLVASIMQKLSDNPIGTFTIGFTETEFNEAIYAKEVAKYLGTHHTELYVSSENIVELLTEMSSRVGEPLGDSSLVPTFLVSQLARKSVTVSLSGDGADELFGGYKTYNRIPFLWNIIKFIPLKLRKELAQALTAPFLPNRFEALSRVISSENQFMFFDNFMSSYSNVDEIVIGAESSLGLYHVCQEFEYMKNFEEMIMASDLRTYLVDDILVKVDRATMANSLESRAPFLDTKIMEFAYSLPFNMKFSNNGGKLILKELLKKHLPDQLVDRPKKGFSVPLSSWLRGPLNTWANELLNYDKLSKDGYFNALNVRNIWLEHCSGRRDYSRLLWNILMFQQWLDSK